MTDKAKAGMAGLKQKDRYMCLRCRGDTYLVKRVSGAFTPFLHSVIIFGLALILVKHIMTDKAERNMMVACKDERGSSFVRVLTRREKYPGIKG
jgi:hypothetical protein